MHRLNIVVSKYRRKLEQCLPEFSVYNSCSADFESHVEEQKFWLKVGCRFVLSFLIFLDSALD